MGMRSELFSLVLHAYRHKLCTYCMLVEKVIVQKPKYSRTFIIRASINRASHRYAVPLHFQCADGVVSGQPAVRISTTEKKMTSERVNKRQRVVLNNVF
jgi:hypothetical protein